MPIIHATEFSEDEIFSGVRSRPMVNSSLGSPSMTINQITIAPTATIPAHIHPSHEEVLIIVEGIFSYELEKENGILTNGDTILIPPQQRHQIVNISDIIGTVIAIFPVAVPERIIVD
jgi:quercetin dioxygenase-like cupin family protein